MTSFLYAASIIGGPTQLIKTFIAPGRDGL